MKPACPHLLMAYTGRDNFFLKLGSTHEWLSNREMKQKRHQDQKYICWYTPVGTSEGNRNFLHTATTPGACCATRSSARRPRTLLLSPCIHASMGLGTAFCIATRRQAAICKPGTELELLPAYHKHSGYPLQP